MLRFISTIAAVLLLAAASYAVAQSPQSRLNTPIDDSRVVTLAGNVHPLARPDLYESQVDPDMRLDRMIILLQPSAAQQAELDALVVAQHDPRSPLFHQWLTTAAYAARFGVSTHDVARITVWLKLHGFTIDEIPAGNRLIVFSGAAAQVDDAFHTAMRRYRIRGQSHIANAEDPQIPASLAGLVSGIVSLHDFRRASSISAHRALAAAPQWNLAGTHYLYPADFAAIYDLNPLYDGGTQGAGVSIAIAGRSNINLADVAAFRASAGLAPNSPTVTLPGANPGLLNGDQDEATLDVEWAGALAPQAAVNLVSAASTATTDGVDLAAAYIVNHALAPVVSVSFGSCEQQMGATELAFYNSLWQQAASQGISVFVASGDSGAAGCNLGSDSTGSVNAVNGLCSSPYATCVGGTEFNEGSNPGQYWTQSVGANQGSALGYIPEMVWNESASNGGAFLWATGGGVSQFYSQPAWQQQAGGAALANGMRAVPDLSFTAASHDGYIINENGFNWIVSGTSAASPAMAAVIAMVIQSSGGKAQGNANPVLYALAGSGAFHPTRAGNNTVPGVAGFTAGGTTYNLATGLGSVDAKLLIQDWSTGTTAPPTLKLASLPAVITIRRGASVSVSIAASATGAFTGPLSLSISGLPAGVFAEWSANPVLPADGKARFTLTLRAASSARLGTSQPRLTASGSALCASSSLTLQVQLAPPRRRVGPLPVLPRVAY